MDHSVFNALKYCNLKQETASLCKASLIHSPLLPACVCKICVVKVELVHTKLCVFACAPLLVAVYVSALIWQALLGCRQLDNGPCSACWKNPFKGAAGRECHITYFCIYLPLVLSLVLSVSLWWEVATAQIGNSCGRFGKWPFPPTYSLCLSPHLVLL